MGNIRSGVAIRLGAISTLVDVRGAVAEAESLRTVCAHGHAPTRVRQTTACPQCGAGGGFGSARERPDGTLDMLPAGTVAKVDPALRDTLTLAVHPAAQVALPPAGSTYYLAPHGADDLYALLAEVVAARPDLAFVVRWAVKTRPATYRVVNVNGVLTLVALASPELLRPAPNVPVGAPTAMVNAALATLDAACTDFDVAAHRDERLAALPPVPDAPAPVTATDPAEGLARLATVARSVAPPPEPAAPVRRRALTAPGADPALRDLAAALAAVSVR